MVSYFYNDSVTVLRSFSSMSTRGIGGQLIQTWSTYIDVVGSFQKVNANWSIIQNIQDYRKNKMFYCDIVDIVDTDQIRYNGKDYFIVTVDPVVNHLEIMLRSS